MDTSSPNLQPAEVDGAAPGRLRACREALLGAVLAAHKAGTLDELLQRRPTITRRFGRRLLAPVREVAGDALPADPMNVAAWLLLLRASLARLRPDGAAGLQGIDREDWLARTSWRPFLALACHSGFVAVTPAADHYRARAGETVADHLCGLWNVGPSTFYRYLERARQRLTDLAFERPQPGERGLLLHGLLQEELYGALPLRDAPARVAFHARQAALAQASRVAFAALWHHLRAGDAAGVVHTLQRFPVELASDARTDALLLRWPGEHFDARLRVELCLAQAGLWRVRGQEQAERQALDDAQRLAGAANDKRLLGMVYGAMGKFNEARDPDRAFACYEESVEFLRQAGLPEDPAGADADVLARYVETLVKLAWLFLLRNDPRSLANLERAEALRAHCDHAPEVLAMLEQTWGEYWRRSGDLARALAHKHRALHMYERLGDRPSVLKTYGNLSLIYSDAKDFARAIDYSQRVLRMAERYTVEPETVAATHLHLGATYFWQGRYDPSIEHYLQALDIARQARLLVLVGRAHYNLAEAYYKRFQAGEAAEDERLGDRHTEAALACWQEGSNPALVGATRKLKRDILGPRDNEFYDRLLPGELAAHFDEMSEVQRLRASLALPLDATERIAAHLALAQAYLEIVVKEREAAVGLIEAQQLHALFEPRLQTLRATFERATSREQRLAWQWQKDSVDVMGSTRGTELLQHLLHAGHINKSGYARLCGVGLTTASKHLALLAERGLLAQTGKGPSTRYRLPG